MAKIQYKNSNIHFTIKGKGPTLILLHGFLETSAIWKNIIPHFTKTHQVICIDLLGHGKSDSIGYIHTMDAMADAVFAVIQQLKIKQAHFVGHSLGGYVALALAKKHAHLFKGLCLMNSTFEADIAERKTIRTRAITMAQTNLKELIRMSFINLFAQESRETFKIEIDEALQIALQTSTQSYIAAQEGMKARPDYFELYKQMNCKKLIIIGEKDTIINSDSLIHKIKDTDIDYTLLPNGHMSYIESKQELLNSLIDFIET